MKKTITIDDPKHIADGCKLYLTTSRKYGVTGYQSRWWIIDIYRNAESDWGFISKKEALQEANNFEKNQIENGLEDDKNVYNPSRVNREYQQCFPRGFHNRYLTD